MVTRTQFSVLILTMLLIGSCQGEDFYVKLIQSNHGKDCLILAQESIQRYKGFSDPESLHALHIVKKDAISSPGDAHIKFDSTDQVIEIFARDPQVLRIHLEMLCGNTEHVPPYVKYLGDGTNEPEIVKIVDSGDQSNRIDVVFMGDGYTLIEREKFFDDIRRLTKDMFEGITFQSYLPVFNIWAIYVPSKYSGIGYNGPEDTPFGLYRQSGELRAIFPGNSAYARQICRLTGPGGCDYPSLIGNDDFYGGLGGEFVISTKSNRTGTVVLRHEMGHNFVDVGEEYDNGYVYSGVNSATSVDSLGWNHWLTGQKREEKAIYRVLKYPWQDLSLVNKSSFSFRSDGKYSRWYIIVSVSAAGEEDSLEFVLDGKILPWKTRGSDDREFYDWSSDAGFTSGEHTFSVRSKTSPTNENIPRMICSINIHEFGDESEFHADNSHISAYPTWDAFGRKVFRPTNAGCLMMNMTHDALCSVCKEGMWYEFFKRISLIDDIEITPSSEDEQFHQVVLNTIKLGQLRKQDQVQIVGEKLEVKWYLNGIEVESLRDKFEIEVLNGSGQWTVQVKFITPEVKYDPNNLLTEIREFSV